MISPTKIGRGFTRIKILSAEKRMKLALIPGVQVLDDGRVIFQHSKLHEVLRVVSPK